MIYKINPYNYVKMKQGKTDKANWLFVTSFYNFYRFHQYHIKVNMSAQKERLVWQIEQNTM